MLQVEFNRNRDTNPEPFTLSEFCFWTEVQEKPLPPSAAGAAMLKLIEQNLLPAFAMDGPWLVDLEVQGRNQSPPLRLCWAADDAILLAPTREDINHWRGFLILKSSASGKVKEFYSEKGDSIVFEIPADIVPRNAFAMAKADILLKIGGREN